MWWVVFVFVFFFSLGWLNEESLSGIAEVGEAMCCVQIPAQHIPKEDLYPLEVFTKQADCTYTHPGVAV